MSTAYKIPLTTFVILALIALLSFFFYGFSFEGFLFFHGFFAMPVGVLVAVTGLISLFSGKQNREIAYGLLLTGALLILTGYFAMSTISFGR